MYGEELRVSESEKEAAITSWSKLHFLSPVGFGASTRLIDINQLNPLGIHPERVRRGEVRRLGTG